MTILLARRLEHGAQAAGGDGAEADLLESIRASVMGTHNTPPLLVPIFQMPGRRWGDAFVRASGMIGEEADTAGVQGDGVGPAIFNPGGGGVLPSPVAPHVGR